VVTCAVRPEREAARPQRHPAADEILDMKAFGERRASMICASETTRWSSQATCTPVQSTGAVINHQGGLLTPDPGYAHRLQSAAKEVLLHLDPAPDGIDLPTRWIRG
jgi:hypothetical protein